MVPRTVGRIQTAKSVSELHFTDLASAAATLAGATSFNIAYARDSTASGNDGAERFTSVTDIGGTTAMPSNGPRLMDAVDSSHFGASGTLFARSLRVC